MLKVAVHGALGRMGRRLVALVAGAGDLELAAAVEAPGTPGIGSPVKGVIPQAPDGVILSEHYTGGADVVIDFSFHTASAALAREVAETRTPLVIGTTGFAAEELRAIDAASQKIALLIAPNMSVGANVLFDIAAETASLLGADFDVEIIEAHHRFKKDAPSGTALEVARRIRDARGLGEEAFIFGRHGHTGERPPDQIAIHAVRAGDIVGDHTVLFSCLGERLELTHRAHTRDAFALGALRAARFLAGRPPGKYTYKDVLKAT
ncbi:MAG: 4-hydroxy-tetrahydrodipicolinate reductase [Planctomycetes bacterium]|nr:4-hydroxy-tetrahydrodipicolinate reductase [Planctomycetota bacterium]